MRRTKNSCYLEALTESFRKIKDLGIGLNGSEHDRKVEIGKFLDKEVLLWSEWAREGLCKKYGTMFVDIAINRLTLDIYDYFNNKK